MVSGLKESFPNNYNEKPWRYNQIPFASIIFSMCNETLIASFWAGKRKYFQQYSLTQT